MNPYFITLVIFIAAVGALSFIYGHLEQSVDFIGFGLLCFVFVAVLLAGAALDWEDTHKSKQLPVTVNTGNITEMNVSPNTTVDMSTKAPKDEHK